MDFNIDDEIKNLIDDWALDIEAKYVSVFTYQVLEIVSRQLEGIAEDLLNDKGGK